MSIGLSSIHFSSTTASAQATVGRPADQSDPVSREQDRTTPANAERKAAAGQRPDSGSPSSQNGQSLDEAELSELKELKTRDREVRAHEAAHQSVGGQHAGSASFTYSRGPDGVQYASSGEVPIDISAVAGNPQATIDKMRTVRAAALAPAQPSSQDRQVAAQAMQIMLQAQSEVGAGEQDATARAENEDDSGPSSREKSEADAAYRDVSRLSDGASAIEDNTSPTAFQATA